MSKEIAGLADFNKQYNCPIETFEMIKGNTIRQARSFTIPQQVLQDKFSLRLSVQGVSPITTPPTIGNVILTRVDIDRQGKEIESFLSSVGFATLAAAFTLLFDSVNSNSVDLTPCRLNIYNTMDITVRVTPFIDILNTPITSPI